MTKLTSVDRRGAGDEARFSEVTALIDQARLRAARAVNRELIDLYWQIGQYVSERLTEGTWGQSVVAEFSAYVQARYRGIQGFSPQNVWRMRQFYETYQGNEFLSPLVREISWSNNMVILAGTKTDEAREFYLRLAIRDHYSKRELERQIDAMLFERAMLSNETNRHAIARHPELTALRDSYLLFFHRGLSCLVAVELKIGRFKPEYLGQLNFYLEALDRDVRKPGENPSVGLVLCSAKDDTVVEYALSRSLSPALVAEYWLALPDKAILQDKLRELRDIQATNNNSESPIRKLPAGELERDRVEGGE